MPQGRPLAADAPADRIAESVYELRLKPGIRFQPHPAFAVDAQGNPRYLGAGIAPEGIGLAALRHGKVHGQLIEKHHVAGIKRGAHAGIGYPYTREPHGKYQRHHERRRSYTPYPVHRGKGLVLRPVFFSPERSHFCCSL